MNGFEYNGVHCSSLGVWYIPDAKDQWRSSPDYEVMSAKVKGRAGGYYYGNDAKERTFTMNCFFEDITLETRERIRHWIDRKTSGRLIFDEQPFVYYNVRPTKLDTGKQYVSKTDKYTHDLYSGTFTITFTAYEPFGYMLYNTYKDFDKDNASIYCGILEENEMPTAPTTASRSFLLYNCGTEVADTVIKIGGVAPNGLTIINHANGNKCTQASLPPTDYITIDSSMGYVLYGGELAFEYHNDGFIRLEPYLPDMTDIVASYTSGSNAVEISNATPHVSWVGKYIYLNNEWIKILSINSGSIVVQKNMAATNIESTRIVTMNEIEISGDGLTLSTLSIDYVPMIL